MTSKYGALPRLGQKIRNILIARRKRVQEEVPTSSAVSLRVLSTDPKPVSNGMLSDIPLTWLPYASCQVCNKRFATSSVPFQYRDVVVLSGLVPYTPLDSAEDVRRTRAAFVKSRCIHYVDWMLPEHIDNPLKRSEFMKGMTDSEVESQTVDRRQFVCRQCLAAGRRGTSEDMFANSSNSAPPCKSYWDLQEQAVNTESLRVSEAEPAPPLGSGIGFSRSDTTGMSVRNVSQLSETALEHARRCWMSQRKLPGLPLRCIADLPSLIPDASIDSRFVDYPRDLLERKVYDRLPETMQSAITFEPYVTGMYNDIPFPLTARIGAYYELARAMYQLGANLMALPAANARDILIETHYELELMREIAEAIANAQQGGGGTASADVVDTERVLRAVQSFVMVQELQKEHERTSRVYQHVEEIFKPWKTKDLYELGVRLLHSSFVLVSMVNANADADVIRNEAVNTAYREGMHLYNMFYKVIKPARMIPLERVSYASENDALVSARLLLDLASLIGDIQEQLQDAQSAVASVNMDIFTQADETVNKVMMAYTASQQSSDELPVVESAQKQKQKQKQLRLLLRELAEKRTRLMQNMPTTIIETHPMTRGYLAQLDNQVKRFSKKLRSDLASAGMLVLPPTSTSIASAEMARTTQNTLLDVFEEEWNRLHVETQQDSARRLVEIAQATAARDSTQAGAATVVAVKYLIDDEPTDRNTNAWKLVSAVQSGAMVCDLSQHVHDIRGAAPSTPVSVNYHLYGPNTGLTTWRIPVGSMVSAPCPYDACNQYFELVGATMTQQQLRAKADSDRTQEESTDHPVWFDKVKLKRLYPRALPKDFMTLYEYAANKSGDRDRSGEGAEVYINEVEANVRVVLPSVFAAQPSAQSVWTFENTYCVAMKHGGPIRQAMSKPLYTTREKLGLLPLRNNALVQHLANRELERRKLGRIRGVPYLPTEKALETSIFGSNTGDFYFKDIRTMNGIAVSFSARERSTVPSEFSSPLIEQSAIDAGVVPRAQISTLTVDFQDQRHPVPLVSRIPGAGSVCPTGYLYSNMYSDAMSVIMRMCVEAHFYHAVSAQLMNPQQAADTFKGLSYAVMEQLPLRPFYGAAMLIKIVEDVCQTMQQALPDQTNSEFNFTSYETFSTPRDMHASLVTLQDTLRPLLTPQSDTRARPYYYVSTIRNAVDLCVRYADDLARLHTHKDGSRSGAHDAARVIKHKYTCVNTLLQLQRSIYITLRDWGNELPETDGVKKRTFHTLNATIVSKCIATCQDVAAQMRLMNAYRTKATDAQVKQVALKWTEDVTRLRAVLGRIRERCKSTYTDVLPTVCTAEGGGNENVALYSTGIYLVGYVVDQLTKAHISARSSGGHGDGRDDGASFVQELQREKKDFTTFLIRITTGMEVTLDAENLNYVRALNVALHMLIDSGTVKTAAPQVTPMQSTVYKDAIYRMQAVAQLQGVTRLPLHHFLLSAPDMVLALAHDVGSARGLEAHVETHSETAAVVLPEILKTAIRDVDVVSSSTGKFEMPLQQFTALCGVTPGDCTRMAGGDASRVVVLVKGDTAYRILAVLLRRISTGSSRTRQARDVLPEEDVGPVETGAFDGEREEAVQAEVQDTVQGADGIESTDEDASIGSSAVSVASQSEEYWYVLFKSAIAMLERTGDRTAPTTGMLNTYAVLADPDAQAYTYDTGGMQVAIKTVAKQEADLQVKMGHMMENTGYEDSDAVVDKMSLIVNAFGPLVDDYCLRSMASILLAKEGDDTYHFYQAQKYLSLYPDAYHPKMMSCVLYRLRSYVPPTLLTTVSPYTFADEYIAHKLCIAIVTLQMKMVKKRNLTAYLNVMKLCFNESIEDFALKISRVIMAIGLAAKVYDTLITERDAMTADGMVHLSLGSSYFLTVGVVTMYVTLFLLGTGTSSSNVLLYIPETSQPKSSNRILTFHEVSGGVNVVYEFDMFTQIILNTPNLIWRASSLITAKVLPTVFAERDKFMDLFKKELYAGNENVTTKYATVDLFWNAMRSGLAERVIVDDDGRKRYSARVSFAGMRVTLARNALDSGAELQDRKQRSEETLRVAKATWNDVIKQ